MKRFLMTLALTGAMTGSMIGCGDDEDPMDDPTPPGDGGTDGSVVTNDGGIDAAVDAGVTVQVSNPGDLCGTNAQCMPSTSATCAMASQFGQPVTGSTGFCTAECTSSAECGDNGSCPVGDLVNGQYGDTFKMNGFPNVDVGQCYEKCTTLGTQGTCETGYTCSNIKTAFGMEDRANVEPAVLLPVCLPNSGLIPPRPPADGGVADGGVGDGGAALIVTGIDSGL